MNWKFKPTACLEGKKAKPIILNLVSPRASGVSTLLLLLKKLYGPGFLALDCSKVCDEHKELGTPIGSQLLGHEDKRVDGDFYPDDLTVRALQEKIGWEMRSHMGAQTFCIGIAGGIRTLPQYAMWQNNGYEIYVTHVHASLREVFEGVERRKKQGVRRKDSRPTAVLASYKKYHQSVVPFVDAVPHSHRLKLDKALPPVEKLSAIIDFLDVPVKEGVIQAFSSPRHPVRLDAIELAQKVSEPVKLNQESEYLIRQHEVKMKVPDITTPATCTSMHLTEAFVSSFLDRRVQHVRA